MVDQEPLSGTLEGRHEYNLDGKPVYQRHIHNVRQLRVTIRPASQDHPADPRYVRQRRVHLHRCLALSVS